MAKKCCGKYKKGKGYCNKCPKIKRKYKNKNKHYKEQKNKKHINRLEKQMAFIIEIDKLKTIQRQSYIIDGSKKENDAEHSWHIAVMALILSEHKAFKKVDMLKVVKMLLIHDIVEIDAGDTYIYDEKGNADKREREEAAAKRLFGLLPKDQKKEYYNLWLEFEDQHSKEAKYANVLDRLQPILLNYEAGGQSWIEHGVSKDMIMNKNVATQEGSKKIWQHFETIINDAVKKGYVKE
ncbi:putative hydrolase of HD superfamily [Natranaerovirga hydrolytica]|uniref:Putative hydrolase of HD superfamily n=1 Tax=Natranaerovirga hydrolytica TaxID=680378 RepID=A0A4R1MDE5_9FIRM|nr:putative hydrolase of HD superfamily [Natranaerovirga hydrolytica]